MGIIISVIVVAWLLFNGYRFFSKKENLKLYRHIKEAFRWWMPPAAILAIACVIGSSYGLYQVSDIFHISWLNLFGMNGGNVLTGGGTSSTNSNASHATNTNTHISLIGLLITIMIPVILLPIIPLFAYAEEFKFRTGAEERSFWGNTLKCLQFGLMHMIVGVPLAIGLGLTFGGIAFTLTYLHRYKQVQDKVLATDRSAALHTTYNYILLSVVIMGAITSYVIQ